MTNSAVIVPVTPRADLDKGQSHWRHVHVFSLRAFLFKRTPSGSGTASGVLRKNGPSKPVPTCHRRIKNSRTAGHRGVRRCNRWNIRRAPKIHKGSGLALVESVEIETHAAVQERWRPAYSGRSCIQISGGRIARRRAHDRNESSRRQTSRALGSHPREIRWSLKRILRAARKVPLLRQRFALKLTHMLSPDRESPVSDAPSD